MADTFEEANRATEEMFAQDMNWGAEGTMNDEMPEENSEEGMPEDEAPVQGVQQEIPEEEGPQDLTPEEAALTDATNTAEIAAEVAAQKDAELTALRQQMDEMQRQNENMYRTIEELSRRNEEHIIEEVLEPPVLDIASLAFADENTIKAAQAQYAKDMAEYNRKSFMEEFAPVIEQANKAKHDEEKNEVISILSQIPELRGIDGMLPQLDRIIANNKALSSDSVPIDEKYITAFAIAKGVNSINTPPPPEPKVQTTDELMALYNSNPEFQEMVERQRIDQVKNSQQVPPMSASSGAAGAALNIKEKPQTLEEASRRTREMFGMM